ncbi:MAG: DUF4331 domain-containing protein [Candidatus Wallbacteria bacterium]|nr:DUF4331 domain-containing protein [Candidatus Wallbacteria bacterium]
MNSIWQTWRRTGGGWALLVALLALGLGLSAPALASSHREAPLISQDPLSDNTDVYFFRVAGDRVCIIANFIPLQFPQSGPNFWKFDDNVLYELKVDNDGDALPDLTYQFRFTTTVGNGSTFLYNTGVIDNLTDADWNVKQTYTLTLLREGQSAQVLGTNLACPPVNIGPRSTPNYATLANAAINTLPAHGNAKVFCGQREEPFFADLGSIFDLLGLRPVNSPGSLGVDGLAGANVHSIILEVPISTLSAAANNTGIAGVWSTASRPAVRILRDRPPRFSTERGAFVQVSRLAMPLVNEVVIPLKDKDKFNGSNPRDDAQFLSYVTDPELARLYTLVYGLRVPATPRNDLVQVFLTGVPGLNQPANVRPAEMIRLNMATPITPSPNPLGVIAGDLQGYPNGRRPVDDVVDISLRAVGGVLVTGFTDTPNGKSLTDGVDRNDASSGAFQSVFPYLLDPVPGFR